MTEGSRRAAAHPVKKIAGGMAARWRGPCPLTCFPTPAVASGFDYPWAGCVPAEPACVSSKVVAREGCGGPVAADYLGLAF